MVWLRAHVEYRPTTASEIRGWIQNRGGFKRMLAIWCTVCLKGRKGEPVNLPLAIMCWSVIIPYLFAHPAYYLTARLKLRDDCNREVAAIERCR